MSEWYSRLRERLPDGRIVPELVAAVENLPGMTRWSPDQGLETRAWDIIRWGFVLWSIRALSNLETIRGAIAKDILEAGKPSATRLAEISGAGLCVAFGATSGERLDCGESKTADWRMSWSSGQAVDVEVTKAVQKNEHVRRQGLAEELTNALFSFNPEDDIVVHITDPTVEEDRNAVLTVAQAIHSGEMRELLGRWEVRSEPIRREPSIVFSGELDARPSWWSPANARCWQLKTMLAGPESSRASAQVRLFFGVPYSAYINPVMKKVDAPQGRSGYPFLVVTDICDLPGAFSELPQAIAGYLPFSKWTSGILLFQDFSDFRKVGWLWRLINNPHADFPLSRELLDGRADLGRTTETGIQLNESAVRDGTA